MTGEQVEQTQVEPQETGSDSQLNDAWDEVLGSEGDTTEAAETPTAEGGEGATEPKAPAEASGEKPPDNAESSRLGRKVKEQELTIAEIKLQNVTLLREMQKLNERLAPTPLKGQEEEPEIPEYITTPADLERYQAAKQYHASKKQQTYNTEYHKLLGDIGKANDDKEAHQHIVAMMLNSVKDGSNTYNRAFGGNVISDVIANYSAAESTYYKGKMNSVNADSAVGRGEQAVGTAVAASGKMAVAAKGLPKLDADAQSMVKGMKAMGISDAEIAAALSEDAPPVRRRA